jgi:hypothetical protein
MHERARENGASDFPPPIQFAARKALDARVPSLCGHAEGWDELTIDGSIEARDCLLRYERCGRVLVVASIYREIWRPN